MDFSLGKTCWHVVGYLNGDLWRPTKLCGARRTEYDLGGAAFDVVASEMPLCHTCNRITDGQAEEIVNYERALSGIN